uniref:Uncharacterized protein n=1 Tax=Lotharella globosa TaxID=91324 RepID=A0A6V3REQ8_9EUKA|mmetsp:Transcript_1640/g.3110  ORF Transcript_1640/g.3110 Transcript_1640/m.3110 type:complete len:180 (+) Transcript_1640:29-568(+)
MELARIARLGKAIRRSFATLRPKRDQSFLSEYRADLLENNFAPDVTPESNVSISAASVARLHQESVKPFQEPSSNNRFRPDIAEEKQENIQDNSSSNPDLHPLPSAVEFVQTQNQNLRAPPRPAFMRRKEMPTLSLSTSAQQNWQHKVDMRKSTSISLVPSGRGWRWPKALMSARTRPE